MPSQLTFSDLLTCLGHRVRAWKTQSANKIFPQPSLFQRRTGQKTLQYADLIRVPGHDQPETQDPLLMTSLVWTGPSAYGRKSVSAASGSSSAMWQGQERWCTCSKQIIGVHPCWRNAEWIRTYAGFPTPTQWLRFCFSGFTKWVSAPRDLRKQVYLAAMSVSKVFVLNPSCVWKTFLPWKANIQAEGDQKVLCVVFLFCFVFIQRFPALVKILYVIWAHLLLVTIPWGRWC